MTTSNYFQLIVPAYRQEKTIKMDLKNIDETLPAWTSLEYDYEIICVVMDF